MRGLILRFLNVSIFLLLSSILGAHSAQAQVVAGNLYRIVSTCGAGNMVFTVASESLANGASVVIGTRDVTRKSQIYKFDAVPGGYKITAQHSGKSLDIKGVSKVNGAPLTQYDYGGGANQIFTISSPSSGVYSFKSVNSGLMLDLTNGATTAGTPLVQWAAGTNCNQKFKLESVLSSGGNYRIISTCDPLNTKVMTVAGDSVAVNTQIVLGTRSTTRNSQIFKFEAVTGGYKITNAGSRKVFDIAAGSIQPSANLIQSTYTAVNSQIFKVTAPAPGIFSFQNLNSGLFVDLTSGLTADGTKFVQWGSSGTCAQKYKLEPATPNTSLPTDSIFAPTSFWYNVIPANAPLNPNQAQYLAEFARQRIPYSGNVTVNTYQYSSPVYIAPAGTPTVKVTQWDCQNKGYLDSSLATQFAAVPIPSYAQQSAGTDGEMTVYQPSTDTVWEFWKVRKNSAGGWEACWGGRLQNASKSDGVFPTYYGTTATSLPFLGGQITAEEIARGEIKHAIGIALIDAAKAVYSYPAHRTDGNGVGPIPEGTRFRLDPTVNVDTLNMSPAGKVIAKAAQKYGFVVWDRAGALSLRAQNAISYTAMGEANPYPTVFDNKPNYSIMNGFPWSKLQFLPLNYGKP